MTDYSEPLVHLKQRVKLLEDGLSQKASKDVMYQIMFAIGENCRKLSAYIGRIEK